MNKTIQVPLSEEDINTLKAGDYVYLSGIIYTARDAAHKRMDEALDRGEELPIDIKNQAIYYMGPSPAREGRPIGSAGPTTASRMDKYAPRLLDLGLDRDVTDLSGGQRTKVLLAKLLLEKPDILLLDEPTQGIDVGAKADIYQLIDRLAREGMGVIVVSSDLIEIINLSNRIVVMRDGQAIKTLESDELTEENVMLYAMGVNADEKA